MTDLLRLILDTLQLLNPLRRCKPWEAGLYLVWSRHCWTVGAGIWPVIPYFCELLTMPIKPRMETTALQSVTLRDGRTLIYSASFKYEVTDPALAYLTLDHWHETVIEMVARVLSEELQYVEPDRLSPVRGKRDRVLSELLKELNAECEPYGMRVLKLGFNNFLTNVRTVRLLVDRAVMGGPTVPLGPG